MFSFLEQIFNDVLERGVSTRYRLQHRKQWKEKKRQTACVDKMCSPHPADEHFS